MPSRNQRRTRHRKNRRIGEGQFGYVVSPAIPCTGRNVSRKVSKLFKKQANINNIFKRQYKNFATRRSKLEPVIEKLRELDPDQTHFLYPEFCDTPGELTNELRANGVTNESKHESYLMEHGGISFKSSLEPFVQMVNAALDKDSSEEYTSYERQKDIRDKLYKIMHPLVKQTDDLLTKLYDSHILHGDLHHGNILVMPSRDTMASIASIIRTVNSVKKSPSYIEYNRTLGSKNQFFGVYPMTKEQTESAYALVDELAAAKPFESTIVQIIDWDSAKIVEEINNDEESEERNSVLSMFFGNPRFLRRFYKE